MTKQYKRKAYTTNRNRRKKKISHLPSLTSKNKKKAKTKKNGVSTGSK